MEDRTEISPFRFTTRCHGRPYFSEQECRILATCLAPRRFPAPAAIPPVGGHSTGRDAADYSNCPGRESIVHRIRSLLLLP